MDSKNIKSVHLVEEIIEEILSRLPVKSLVRFRCVSKSWLSLITSEKFIETHLRNSRKNRAFSHHRVIFDSTVCDTEVLNICSLQQLLNEPSSIEPSPIYDPNYQDSIVMGCCNGLICLDNHKSNFCLWNPATRISIELPKLRCLWRAKYGFGWDGSSGAYKVFVHSRNRRGIVDIMDKGYIYSSKTNSWKTVDHGCLSLYDRFGVFACGKIHWISRDGYMESLDLESEEFGRIELPFNPPDFLRYWLAEIGGCLHLLCVHKQQSYGVVWVMKECGWLTLVTLPLSFDPEPETLFCQLFGGGPNGEILLIFYDNYLVYSFKDDVHVVRAGKNRFSFYDGFVYVESLVSPNLTTAS